MSYLKFDKTLMTNLEEALPREILRTNRSGAYHCTTIVDCNTRKYHGLLVIPVPELDDENHVLLSSLDETVIQHGAEFNLGLHKYQGDNYSPRGHKYIREFECEKVPTTIYRVGGVILKKEKLFVHHENRILIRYTLLDAHSATTLRLRPFLAFRSVREYTHEDDFIQQLAATFECYDCVLECRKFRIVGNGSDFLVQLPDSFVESWFILFCFDLVERRSSERSPISLEKGIFSILFHVLSC